MNQAGLDQLQDAVTLKLDGRRLSLEGVLTGTALGVLLIYLVEEAANAILRPVGGKPINAPDDLDLGAFGGPLGSISVAPLDEVVDLGPGNRPRPSSGGDEAAPLSSLSGRGGQFRGIAEPREIAELLSGRPADLPPERRDPTGAAGRTGSPPTASNPPIPPAPPPQPQPPPEPPIDPPEPPDPPPLPQDRVLQPLVLVLVRGDEQATSRSLQERAATLQSPSQVGVAFSTINLEQAGGAGFEVLSDRRLQGSGLSPFDDATLSIIASHAAMVGSQLLGGARADVVLLSARELISLGLLTPGEASASLRSDTVALADSTIVDPGGNNLLMLQANTQLSFIGLGDSQRSSLVFDLLTQGLRDSAIALGGGDDAVSVISGFRGGLGIIGVAGTQRDPGAESNAPGLQLSLQDQTTLMAEPENWALKLSATSIALQDSSLSTGAGKDVVSISSLIDASLAADLGSLFKDPKTTISLQRIGLLRSNLDVGPGDDLVRINGAVIDSTIDLGTGDNLLILESPVSGNSRILSDRGRNRIIVNDSLGGVLTGGSGDDRFDLNSQAVAGLLDGGAGNDTLASASRRQRDLALIQGRNAGFLGGLQFRDIETLDLGRGDDVALISLEGTLSGRLLGGDGLDRLEFSNWDLPVSVDLDLGSATGIFDGARGGISGFEQVYGGSANDLLAASGLHDGLSGQEGDDVLFLRWSPWLSRDGHGLQLRGDGGQDLFVIAGLESAIPPEWDGLSGIPVLTDLQLDLRDPGAGGGDRLGWLRQGSGADGATGESFIPLTPAGLEGLGDARLLPIAPLEQLLSGMSDATSQLAIAWDPSRDNGLAELRLLGSEGPGSSRLIAYVPTEAPGQPSSLSRAV